MSKRKAGGPPMGRAPMGGRPNADLKPIGRALRKVKEYYPVRLPMTIVCILICALVSSVPSLFTQKVLAVIEKWYRTGDWASARPEVLRYLLILGILYLAAILLQILYTQTMAVITQGTLNKMRQELFGRMQDLPIRYFDTHKHGDIMSYYTNDIDALRQFISQLLPNVIQSFAVLLVVFAIMLYFSLWLTLVVIVGIVLMLLVSKNVGGGSAKYFVLQQKSVAQTEGYVQEMMNGQKVVKVFCREQQTMEGFDKVNDELFENAYRANAFANVLGPIIANIGNILYVLLAIVGGLLLLAGVPNVSLSGMAMSITILVPFLNMAKQFTGNLNNLSMQLSSLVMAAAGAGRLFELMDQVPEEDEGTVTLVDAEIAPDGTVREASRHTGHWAWKCPVEDGFRYVELKGDVVLDSVDFGYEEDKPVLHDVSVYARPGQKVAFVGATGAGKTTITNLINRFYDIADGKIRYDGININHIRKSDLRLSLGIVLQETNLFTGTVMENIRYGKLNATEEEVIAAATLAGAHDFITRLPEGYDTMLTNNGSNLSQGQRQLLAIARAAVADPPVMILDEATSSIDTHTEAIVQRGMDKLMEGRTVFVIAHRLSTVMNSDVIMVLDHGRIIERGSHKDLIEAKGTYYQLYTGAFELE